MSRPPSDVHLCTMMYLRKNGRGERQYLFIQFIMGSSCSRSSSTSVADSSTYKSGMLLAAKQGDVVHILNKLDTSLECWRDGDLQMDIMETLNQKAVFNALRHEVAECHHICAVTAAFEAGFHDLGMYIVEVSQDALCEHDYIFAFAQCVAECNDITIVRRALAVRCDVRDMVLQSLIQCVQP